MATFICTNCGYRFKSEKIKRCPYCSSENVEEEKTAEELVDSIDIE